MHSGSLCRHRMSFSVALILSVFFCTEYLRPGPARPPVCSIAPLSCLYDGHVTASYNNLCYCYYYCCYYYANKRDYRGVWCVNAAGGQVLAAAVL